jgi:tRNA threonylcarbamoyladenosine biosynthesis protein TsaE
VAKGLRIDEAVKSPTFNLLLVHEIASASDVERDQAGQLTHPPHALYHFDLYRLDKVEELVDLDYFGLLEDGAISLVEWGDRFAQALPHDYILVNIDILINDRRNLSFTAYGPKSEAMLAAWRQTGMQSKDE